MAVAFNFDARAYDPNTGGQDIFETGDYQFQIVESTTQKTKRQDGTMLVLTAACMDEGQSGRQMAIRLNLQNANPQAVDIALRDLSAISYVVGVLEWSSTAQLHGRPFRMRVEKLPRKDDPTKFTNEIRGYFDMQGNPPTPVEGGGTIAPAAPPAPVPAAPVPAAPVPAAPVPAAPVAPAPFTPGPAAPAPAAPAAGGVTPPWAT